MDELMQRMLDAESIAVVGISDDPSRTSHIIARYLIDAGYELFGVNPNLKTVLGRPCYASLKLIPHYIDLVNVFRRPEYLPGIIADAVYVNAGGVWVQSGISNPAARHAAIAAEMDYVEDRCIMIEHQRLKRP